jgi:hypothetical protein
MIIDGTLGLDFPDGSDQTTAFTGNAATIISGTIATARLATGTANASTYLRGDQTWATIPGSQWVTTGSDIYYNTGNVGIGTASPSYKLTVAGASTAGSVTALAIENPSTNGASEVRQEWRAGGTTFGYISVSYNNNAAYMALSAGGAESMRITNSGNLGLGVTPSAWISTFKAMDIGAAGAVIYPNDISSMHLAANGFVNSAGNWIYKNTAAAVYYGLVNGQHRWFNAPSGTAGNAITFTQAMTLDASGNLGIGTTSPGQRLSVDSGTTNIVANFNSNNATDGGYIRFQNSGTSIGDIGSGKNVVNGAIGDFGFSSRAGSLVFGTGSAERLRIASAGQIGIGGANYGTAGQVLTSGGSGAAPSWADVSVTTAAVLAATAGASLGAVGAYSWLWTTTTGAVTAGTTIAGSNLRYAGFQTGASGDSNNSDNSLSGNGGTPSGTWRVMGRGAQTNYSVFLGLRIS